MPMINLAEGMARVWIKRCVGFIVLCGWLLILSYLVLMNFPSTEPWQMVFIVTGIQLTYLRPGLEVEKLHYNVSGLGRAFWILFIINTNTVAFTWAWLLYWVVEGKPFNADRVNYVAFAVSIVLNLMMATLTARARGRNWNDLVGKMELTGIIFQWLTEPPLLILLCLKHFNIWHGFFNQIVLGTIIVLAIGLALQVAGHILHGCKHGEADFWLIATAAQESELSPELEPLEKGESKAMYKSCERSPDCRVEENCKVVNKSLSSKSLGKASLGKTSPRSRSPGSPPAKSSPGKSGPPGSPSSKKRSPGSPSPGLRTPASPAPKKRSQGSPSPGPQPAGSPRRSQQSPRSLPPTASPRSPPAGSPSRKPFKSESQTSLGRSGSLPWSSVKSEGKQATWK